MKQQKSPIQQIDYTLLFLLFLLICASMIAIYAGTTGQYVDLETNRGYFVIRQAIWYFAGLVLMVIFMLIDYEYYKYFTIPAYIVGMGLLLWVEFFGVVRNGAQRWIGINDTPIYQPSEIVKIVVILALAHILYRATRARKRATIKDDFILLAKILAIGLPPFFLILKQPDLGTALVIVAIIATMILVSGISWKIITPIVTAGVAAIIALGYLFLFHIEFFEKYILSGHQLERIYAWVYPDEYVGSFSLQPVRALIGIGSGQLYGKGFLESVQAQTMAIPEMHTDFIFAVIGEEFGFIGATGLIIIFFLLFYRMVIIALTCNNLFGTYLVSGVIGLLVFQIFQNIAMTIGLMPVTGIALPFISYGGSALLTNMVAIGIVLNVNMRTKHYLFESEDEN